MNIPAPENLSAFPEIITDDFHYDDPDRPFQANVHSVGGLSLRDYFAAKAMQGLIVDGEIKAVSKGFEATLRAIAESAYCFADAMLAERAKNKTS